MKVADKNLLPRTQFHRAKREVSLGVFLLRYTDKGNYPWSLRGAGVAPALHEYYVGDECVLVPSSVLREAHAAHRHFPAFLFPSRNAHVSRIICRPPIDVQLQIITGKCS